MFHVCMSDHKQCMRIRERFVRLISIIFQIFAIQLRFDCTVDNKSNYGDQSRNRNHRGECVSIWRERKNKKLNSLEITQRSEAQKWFSA